MPERLPIERRVGLGDDLGDRVVDACRNPRLVDQRLELRRLVERNCGHLYLLVDPGCQLPTQISLGGGTPRHALCGQGREDRIN